MDEFAKQVLEMKERVTELSRSYAILLVLQDTGNCKRYSKVYLDHRDFFNAIASSLFQGFCVITYQLFDYKRTDVKSLPSLVKNLAHIDSDLERRLATNIAAHRELLDKYFAYRHKIFAHRDKEKSPHQIFGSVPKPRAKREMETIVRLARN